MIIRRYLLIVLGAGTFAPQILFAQSKKPPVVIGWLTWQSRAYAQRYRDVFTKEFAVLGWREGSNYVIEGRYADGHTDRLPILAEELAAKKPALIVSSPVRAAQAASKAAPTTPIISISADPVTAGLVASYAHPGGMITGVSNVNEEVSTKFLELLLAAAPRVRRVGFLMMTTDLRAKERVHRSVEQYPVEARTVEVTRPDDIEPALAYLSKEGVQALVVMSGGGALASERQRIVTFALARRWPVAGSARLAEDGALVGYGPETSALWRRGAHLADRILKGAKPADLPIERPMTFELVLNMKTAKALGLAIPHEFGVRVDRTIQ